MSGVWIIHICIWVLSTTKYTVYFCDRYFLNSVNVIVMLLQVLKLHTRLGKPIPSTNPVVLSTTTSSTAKTGVATNSTTLGIKPGVKTVTAAVVPTVTKKVTATPKITFVGLYLLPVTVKYSP